MKSQFPVLLLLVSLSADASDLAPFTTDGCSRFPDGTRSQPDLWLECCSEHDVAYWQGGTRDQRRESDLVFKQCVVDVGERLIANVMFAAVRVGGTPYLPTSFRWGYGWPYSRGYKALTASEKESVRAALNDVGREP